MAGDFVKKHRILKSFRLRIFLIFMLIGIIVAGVMRYGMLLNLTDRRVAARTMEITEQMKIMADRIASNEQFLAQGDEKLLSQLALLSTFYDGRILVVDRNFRVVADTYNISLGKTMIGEEVIRCYLQSTISNYNPGGRYIEVAVPVIKTDVQTSESETLGVILASTSADEILQETEELGRRAIIIEAVVLIVLLGVSLLLSVVLVRPFDRVTRAIGSSVTFDDELSVVSDYKETEEIVDAFLKQRQRLKVLDDSRQEFVSNVSHELKTPIASIKVLADSLNVQENVPVEIYKDFMQDITAEIDREDRIISDLLDLVRMDKGAAALHIESKNINELLELTVKRLAPLARKGEVDLILESRRAVVADVDEIKFMQAVTNIIENGIKYNKHPGWVKIVLDADHQYMTLEITDSGVGMPEDELDHIFERFYRGDKSHSKEISGTGLGLAITRRTILLHRGTIEADSVLGEGSGFTVKIPLTFKIGQT